MPDADETEPTRLSRAAQESNINDCGRFLRFRTTYNNYNWNEKI